ncbi:PREDICTED: coiled-coil domain-containing protein 181 [Nicrophorus vespilloides]|uniref:Coiled-coil domain-containing protein 181 n=1 Tax=Nicrophorus vespilloides TaxID=110193 RepID=A0ABM1M2Z7_NICVS|nr:PREDICTED: coiled-coil domain-containing protein 181 [Nicrophorus vespilloides]
MSCSEESNIIKSESEEEEDYESFFLQPASSPYDLKEKLEAANKALLEDDSTLSIREQRVQFHENLVDYEPDLTDDDVQSIESYNESPDQTPVEELQYILSSSRIYDIQEEEEELEEIDEIVEDEIREEIVNDEIDETLETEDGVELEQQEEVEEKLNVVNGNRRSKKCRRRSANYRIDCKNHCIEGFEPQPAASAIDEGRPPCPPLKLRTRKCCERTENVARKLPMYTGCRSEYGLSYRQLERRERRREAVRLREQKSREVQREFAERRRDQNEQIFRQWLREVSVRDAGVGVSTRKPSRPQTAHCPQNNRVKVKRRSRPHTSHPTCVYIKVPEEALRDGLQVGSVVVARKVLSSKQLQIYALQ